MIILKDFKVDPTSSGKVIGDHVCKIVAASIEKSKAGKEMIKVSLQPLGHGFTVFAYFSEGPYFESYLSRFLVAFPAIENYENMNTWVGKYGVATFEESERGYTRVKKFPLPEVAKELLEKAAEAISKEEASAAAKKSEETTGNSVYGGFGNLPDSAIKEAVNLITK